MRTSRLASVIAVSIVLLSACLPRATSLVISPLPREGHDPGIDEAEEKLRLAFMALNAADEMGVSGADVSALAEKLNTALKLLTNARALEADGNNSTATEYASQSLVISNDVRERAGDLRERTSESLLWKRVFLFAVSPIVGLVAAVIFYYVYRARRPPETEKVLRMGIRRKEKNG